MQKIKRGPHCPNCQLPEDDCTCTDKEMRDGWDWSLGNPPGSDHQ